MNKNLNTKQKIKVIACIQARMGSSRLKKKALRKVVKQTIIEHIFKRLKKAKEIDGIVLTTSLNKENDILIKHAQEINLKYYRGNETDLISRLYETCQKFKADAIVRITGDCPLVDPMLVDQMVKIYRKNYQQFDFLTNSFPHTFPHGLDIDILPVTILRRLNNEVKDPFYREWFIYYILENSRKFRIYNMKNSINLFSLRLTLDYPEDLVLIRRIFRALYKKNEVFITKDILNFIEKHPSLLKINAKRIDKTIVGDICSEIYYKLKARKQNEIK